MAQLNFRAISSHDKMDNTSNVWQVEQVYCTSGPVPHKTNSNIEFLQPYFVPADDELLAISKAVEGSGTREADVLPISFLYTVARNCWVTF